MKNYDDIAKRILERRDETLARRRTIIMRTVKTAGSVCACLVIGVSLYLGINRLTKPQIDPNPPSTSTTTTTTTTTATDITGSTTVTTAATTDTTTTGSGTTETTTTLTSTSGTQTCTATTTTTTSTENTTTSEQETPVTTSENTTTTTECTTSFITEFTTTTEMTTTAVPADYRYRYIQLTYNGYTYQTLDSSLWEDQLGALLEVTSATKRDGSDPLPVEIYATSSNDTDNWVAVRFIGTDIICLARRSYI